MLLDWCYNSCDNLFAEFVVALQYLGAVAAGFSQCRGDDSCNIVFWDEKDRERTSSDYSLAIYHKKQMQTAPIIGLSLYDIQ